MKIPRQGSLQWYFWFIKTNALARWHYWLIKIAERSHYRGKVMLTLCFIKMKICPELRRCPVALSTYGEFSFKGLRISISWFEAFWNGKLTITARYRRKKHKRIILREGRWLASATGLPVEFILHPC